MLLRDDIAFVLFSQHPAVLNAKLSLADKLQQLPDISAAHAAACNACLEDSDAGRLLRVNTGYAEACDKVAKALPLAHEVHAIALYVPADGGRRGSKSTRCIAEHFVHQLAGTPRVKVASLVSATTAFNSSASRQDACVNFLRRLGKQLHALALCTVDLHTPAVAAKLAKQLTVISQLQRLDLTDCHLTPASAGALAPDVASLASLTSLMLANNGLKRQGIEALQPLTALTGLQALALSACRIRREGAPALLHLLPAFTALTSLDCGYNFLQGRNGQALGRCLGQLPLRRLVLTWNMLGAGGLHRLLTSMGPLSCLQHLQLDDNDLYDAGVFALSAQCKSFPGLTHLSVAGNFITSSFAVEQLIKELSCHSLASLNLRGNSLEDDGITAVVKALPKLGSALTSVDLSSNDVSRGTRAELAQWLQTQPALQQLQHSGLTQRARTRR